MACVRLFSTVRRLDLRFSRKENQTNFKVHLNHKFKLAGLVVHVLVVIGFLIHLFDKERKSSG